MLIFSTLHVQPVTAACMQTAAMGKSRAVVRSKFSLSKLESKNAI